MKNLQTTRICTLLVTRSCNLNCVYCFERNKNIAGKKMMDYETAVGILIKEFDEFRLVYKPGDRFAIEFFGGEPLLNFDLIKKIWHWVKQQDLDFPYVFQITTNGTLLTPSVRAWLTERKDDFRVILSVDGDELMQAENRGCKIEDIPIVFVRDTWEKSYFKMTISKETLPNYARGIISLMQNDFHIASSLAEGIVWSCEDALLYQKQLTKIAEFLLENPNIKIEHPFNFVYKELLQKDDIVSKNCGVGTSIMTYDTDGTPYPCHLFLPIVHGQDGIDNIMNNIDFTDDSCLIDTECLKCPISKLCRTCYGYNQLDRGDVKSRNMTKCKMLLAELQVVSSFQIQYFMQRKNVLKEEDLEKLYTALKGYELVHSAPFHFV